MIRVVHLGSGCRYSTHPGSRGQKDTGSRIRVRNTGNTGTQQLFLEYGSGFWFRRPKSNKIRIVSTKVSDPHWFNADPDPEFFPIGFYLPSWRRRGRPTWRWTDTRHRLGREKNSTFLVLKKSLKSTLWTNLRFRKRWIRISYVRILILLSR